MTYRMPLASYTSGPGVRNVATVDTPSRTAYSAADGTGGKARSVGWYTSVKENSTPVKETSWTPALETPTMVENGALEKASMPLLGEIATPSGVVGCRAVNCE
jgi:hypothetical protein